MRAVKGDAPLPREETAAHNTHENEGNSILAGMPSLLTVAEAAKILRLSPGRTREACRAGRIPAVQIGAQWRVPRSRLEALLAGGGQ
jgi:excisionase family DNA binding protein